MNSTMVLFKTNSFEFKISHLIIIGILSVAFVVSFLIRIGPLEFGTELNEFDPFFNYRATQYIIENGFPAYLEWHDNMSWYPTGRNVIDTSQLMLHVTASSLYSVFGGGSSLYTFTIFFPVVIGSLTTIIIFALVRTIAGTTSGLFASLFFAISPSVIVRGSLGWFKSEPLGLFYGLLGLFLFLNAIKSKNPKKSIPKLIGAGLFIAFGLSSWGGIQFVLIPLGIFFLAIPFFRNDFKFISWAIPLFTFSLLFTASIFPRPGPSFAFGLGGISLIVPTLFIIACSFIQLKSNLENKKRNCILLLISLIIISSIFLIINSEIKVVNLPSFRYLNAINPFLTTTDSLVDSVSEHATNSINQSFFFSSFFMILAGLGIWFIFKNLSKKQFNIENDMSIFALIFGLVGVYAASSFIRLEMFSSISLIILSSIGLGILVSLFSKLKSSKVTKITYISFIVVMLFFITSPLLFPNAPNWTNVVNGPPTILNGGTKFAISSNDWLDALNWIKNNTPTDSRIVSWWDYGYWIESIGERTTYVDNATLLSTQIENIAQIFFSTPDDAWIKLREMNANYVVIFVSGQKLNSEYPMPLYLLDGGGEESKMPWILKISGEPDSKYLQNNLSTPTDYFWKNTLLGNLIPYSPVLYTDFKQQSDTYSPGFVPIYTKNIKYDQDSTGPFRLVYASNSVNNSSPTLIGVLIYEVNPNYVSANK